MDRNAITANGNDKLINEYPDSSPISSFRAPSVEWSSKPPIVSCTTTMLNSLGSISEGTDTTIEDVISFDEKERLPSLSKEKSPP